MTNYDFSTSLSPIDFELLSKDLLEAELGVQFENFKEGRDKGIDLRYAPISRVIHFRNLYRTLLPSSFGIIVQCKRYSKFSDLKSHLKNSEYVKIKLLKPERYILTTNVPLSPAQAEEIKTILEPFVLTTGDIFGRDRLNSLLQSHPEIERRHIKLWIGSTGVLDALLNAKTHVVSKEEVDKTLLAAKIYVRNRSFDEALEVLKKHRVCIISGLPGIGKTTLARMLLLYFYERKFDIVKIESDISEARAIGYHNEPRFYYYDDFLGQTAQADKLNKNEDQKLIDFMESIRESKQSVFVLTTREYILNQAKLHYEKLDRERFDHRTCIIDLSKYSRRIRAQILYNHLYFSSLPEGFVASLIKSRTYVKIVDHENYNPRLIEYLTDIDWLTETTPADYSEVFIKNLDDPTLIWEHAFNRQLSDRARHLLYVVTTMPTEAWVDDVERAFVAFHEVQCRSCGIPHAKSDFRDALKELDGTFISTRRISRMLLMRFQNPSIRDYMQNRLAGGELTAELISSCVYFEQAHWFAEILSDKTSRMDTAKLKQYERLIINALKQKINAASCSIRVVNYTNTQSCSLEAVSKLDRLAKVVSSSSPGETADAEFVQLNLKELGQQLEAGQVRPIECLVVIGPLRELGHLRTLVGWTFANSVKLAMLSRQSELDDFDTLSGAVTKLPECFSVDELQSIADNYLKFVDGFVEEYVDGQFGIDDPDTVRDDASRLENIDSVLGVSTSVFQEKLESYAKKLEDRAEERREWEPDDDRDFGSGRDEFGDEDLDSMFGTLG